MKRNVKALLLEAGKKVVQETRRYNANRDKTTSMRRIKKMPMTTDISPNPIYYRSILPTNSFRK